MSDGNYYFGTIGRLVEKKNHKTLLKAFSKINDESKLIIIGDGRLLSELKETAQNLGIKSRVHFLGKLEMAHRYLKLSIALSSLRPKKRSLGLSY